MGSNRLSHLLYRCNACHRPLTKLEILDRWEGLEGKGEESRGVCHCGGARISPTNLTPEERASLESWWQGFRYFILGRDDHKTRVWKLWDKEVRGR